MKIGEWTNPPHHGDHRTRRIFALWPRRCDDHAVRWLETLVLEEYYQIGWDDYSYSWRPRSITPAAKRHGLVLVAIPFHRWALWLAGHRGDVFGMAVGLFLAWCAIEAVLLMGQALGAVQAGAS